jgi:hypothetical protein
MHQDYNDISLHTCNPCSFSAGSSTGVNFRPDCDIETGLDQTCDNGTNGAGCGVSGQDGSYGDSFNANEGGVWATLLDSTAIQIWFWPRASIPADITAGAPDPSGWGAPMGDFESSSSCDVGSTWHGQTIVSIGSERQGVVLNCC